MKSGVPISTRDAAEQANAVIDNVMDDEEGIITDLVLHNCLFIYFFSLFILLLRVFWRCRFRGWNGIKDQNALISHRY
jgi:hypothetical protein